jgi:cytochrome c oxidase subunit 4
MAHPQTNSESTIDFTKDADDPVSLLMVYGAIVALTLLTVGVSTQMALGALALPIQLGISATQVCLVGYYFMHLKKGERVLVLTALSSIFWMAILFVLVLSDYLTRTMIVG